MKSVSVWLEEYGVSHQNPTNKIIHWICVPLIIISLVGLLWSIPPIPEPFMVKGFPGLAWNNWGIIFLVVVLIYYAVMSWKLAIGMILAIDLIIGSNYLLDTYLDLPMWMISLTIFVIAWIGQLIGHRIEGEKPSFFEDLQFFLIGPLWLLSFIYKKLGIKY